MTESRRHYPMTARARAGALILGAALVAQFPGGTADAEPAEADTVEAPGSTFIPFPFYMYSPETKSGGGVVATYIHRPDRAPVDRKPSTYTASVLFTQRKQIVIGGGFERYWASDRYQLLAGAEFAEFPDTFYGVGNDTDKDVSEDFTPRTVALSAGLRREILPDVRVGPHASYSHQDMQKVEEGGVLATGSLRGSDGGTLVQLGASASWDRRDNIIYPRAGSLFELSFTGSSEAFGSDFDFTSWNIDLRGYRSISESQVIAVRGLATTMTGEPPFQALAMLGGDNVMRGYYTGRFRDRHRYAVQGEYRLGFWSRTGLVAFADVGDVARDVSGFRIDEVRFAGGFGLRFLLSKAEGVTLRADFGNGDDGAGGLYLSMLEAY